MKSERGLFEVLPRFVADYSHKRYWLASTASLNYQTTGPSGPDGAELEPSARYASSRASPNRLEAHMAAPTIPASLRS